MKQSIVLITAFISLLLPSISSATEWIECYQGVNYSIEFLANPNSDKIIDFTFSENGKRLDLEGWSIESNEIDFNKKSISFKAISSGPSKNFVALESVAKSGKLTVGTQSIAVICDWSLFEAL